MMSEAMTFSESNRSKRSILADQVPLGKPFTIRISPSAVCNLRCEFCPQSIQRDRMRFGKFGVNGLIEYQLFQNIIDDIRLSFGTVKKIVLVGRGEPLLHPQISDMIAYTAKQQAAEQIEILTNGMNLTPQLSNKLVDAGLNTLRISVNGLSAMDYQKHCNTKVDFDRYIEQIKYLYHNKKEMILYIKIINYMVDTEEKREKFRQIFSPICDIINIENLFETDCEIDFRRLTKEYDKLTYSQNTTTQVQTKICSSPFYILQIDEDGSVLPCCNEAADVISLGNVRKMSVGDIWIQKSYSLQRRMLDGVTGIPFCETCKMRLPQTYPEDVLDQAAGRLKNVYDVKLGKVNDRDSLSV